MNRLLLFEAGSTKTTLSIIPDLNKGNVETFMMAGFNPNRPDDRFLDEVEFIDLDKGDSVVFYGSGLAGDKGQNRLKKFFQNKGIQHIEINNDMLGAARALFETNPGIFVIMGTGAVAGYYNGQEIMNRQGGFGYLIDDFGGGYELGKRFVAAWLNGKLAEQVSQEIENHFEVPKKEFIETYYQAFKDDPKTALSSMAKLVEVCNAYRHEEIIQQTVQLYFERFIEDTILPLTIEQKLDSFAAVGSIAYHFHQEIETAAKKHRLTLEKVIQYPASNLIQYHLKRIM
jgi:glucosamine kinase